jgi:hypothetical protein
MRGAKRVKTVMIAAEANSKRATKKFEMPAETIDAPDRIAAIMVATSPDVTPPPTMASDQFTSGEDVSTWDDIFT